MPGPLNGWRVVMGISTDATDVSVSIAHGLPAAPTFVLATSNLIGATVAWTATATTLVLRSDTDAANQDLSYIACVE